MAKDRLCAQYPWLAHRYKPAKFEIVYVVDFSVHDSKILQEALKYWLEQAAVQS